MKWFCHLKLAVEEYVGEHVPRVDTLNVPLIAVNRIVYCIYTRGSWKEITEFCTKELGRLGKSIWVKDITIFSLCISIWLEVYIVWSF